MSQLSLPPSHPDAGIAGPARTSRLPALLAVVVFGSLGFLSACGGDDTASDASSSGDASAEEQSGSDQDGGSDISKGSGDEVFDPAEVQSCLSDAGFETVASSDLLSEQQVADQLTAFGQTESLTFDAAQHSFAGGVSFYETPEQASDRAESLSDVAKAQTLVGTALVSVEAGSDYEAAVEAAESCLGV